MLNSSKRGKRGPAPSWRLGTTRTIRVPIVLADILLKLARQIDNGEVTLINPVAMDKQDHENVATTDDDK